MGNSKIGLFEVSDKTFTTISAGTVPKVSGCNGLFHGAAAVGTKVVFAPWCAEVIGVFDVSDNSFTTLATSALTSLRLTSGGPRLFGGAVAVGTQVVFASYNAGVIGVFETSDNSFDASTGARKGYMRAVAVGPKVVLQPAFDDASAGRIVTVGIVS
jgi:hypothetical protein